jgi:hypothetical protein
VPLDGAGPPPGRRLDGRAAVAGVQHERLDVPVRTDPVVHVGLDVFVEGVLLVGLGERDRRHAGRDTEVGRSGGAVGVAERGAGQGRGAQPEVPGAEAGRGADHLAAEVQGAVDGPLVTGCLGAGPAEDPAPPQPAVARGAVRPPLPVPVTNCEWYAPSRASRARTEPPRAGLGAALARAGTTWRKSIGSPSSVTPTLGQKPRTPRFGNDDPGALP